MMYLKKRRNQLVAALGTAGTGVPCGGSTADVYYKKKNYQLVRKPLVEINVAAGNQSRLEEGKRFNVSSKGKSNSLKALVWRLHDTESKKPVTNVDGSHRAKPFFLGKRTTYLRDKATPPSGFSLSISGQKLLPRSRANCYTRSKNGFSLRRSKVSSGGISNLKWSKSFDNKSKKEATLAVVERNRRQRMAASAVLSRRNHVSRKSVYNIKQQPGEQIFRIGSQQYKMDPTRRTLHRITNDEYQLNSAVQAAEKGKTPYVPKRLYFGNNEYVRIGSGNQLVRNPKKRVRTWASEKVRRSLHAARSRLAKEKKYCQFFTRFGHCNKDDGKCQYIHDPSKIAVCTKFLNGSCSNPNCKLTHKVIPERMPDCSYFLQGLCSSKSCPYRHVNVHPSASLCEGFLKGYCASGNECRQKHTYVCPIFEATGECPQGSKCKLHHPKKRKQTQKPQREQKKARLRYFISGHTETSDCTFTKMTSERHDDDILCEDERIADYVSLDVGYGAVESNVVVPNEQPSDHPAPSEAQVSFLEDFIKPIRLMSKNIQTSAIESPSVDTSLESKM